MLKLIEPITIEVNKHMDFGLLKKGTENIGLANFTVRGEVGKLFNVSSHETTELIHNKNINEKIKINIAFVEQIFREMLKDGVAFTIKGIVVYPKERQLQPGEYNGTITIRVNYM
ncbi:MAG: hypothetical protein ACRC5T_14125 [Cetobacterium sp.]